MRVQLLLPSQSPEGESQHNNLWCKIMKRDTNWVLWAWERAHRTAQLYRNLCSTMEPIVTTKYGSNHFVWFVSVWFRQTTNLAAKQGGAWPPCVLKCETVLQSKAIVVSNVLKTRAYRPSPPAGICLLPGRLNVLPDGTQNLAGLQSSRTGSWQVFLSWNLTSQIVVS